MTENTSDQYIELSIEALKPYPENPFRPYTEDKLAELMESIEEHGQMEPIIVALDPAQDGEEYHILAGHNRVEAFKQLGRTTIRAVVRDVSPEEAAIIVVETNLQKREKILPSEKAKAYKLQFEALKSQGKRTDLMGPNPDKTDSNGTSPQVGEKLRTAEKVGEKAGDSSTNVHRYIRLNELIPSLLDLVDSEKLAFIAGVELSYIAQGSQEIIHNYFFRDKKATLTIKKAEKLHDLPQEKTLTYEAIEDCLCKKQSKKTTSKAIHIPAKKLSDLLDDIDQSNRIDYVIEAIKFYKKNANANSSNTDE